LRKATDIRSSKLVAVMDEVAQFQSENSKCKVIIFSHFTTFMDYIEIPLRNAGIKYVRMDGKYTRVQRIEAIRSFNEDDEITVFLLSIKLGVGLNLTAASKVIICEPWWNVATEEQAIHRVHRFGQKEPVTVVYLTVKGTMDESMLTIQDQKAQESNLILSDKGLANQRLTQQDVSQLFQDRSSEQRTARFNLVFEQIMGQHNMMINPPQQQNVVIPQPIFPTIEQMQQVQQQIRNQQMQQQLQQLQQMQNNQQNLRNMEIPQPPVVPETKPEKTSPKNQPTNVNAAPKTRAKSGPTQKKKPKMY